MLPIRFHEDDCRLFLRAIQRPIDCREMRFLNADIDRGGMIHPSERYTKNLGGWYDSIDAMVNTLRGLINTSGYITANPVKRELLARSYNKPMTLRRGEESTGGTTDADILCHRYLYLDIDPIRPGGISATQEEVEAAIARRDLILDRHRAIADSSIWGRSGNGCFILVYLPDLAVSDATTGLLKRFLAVLGALYDDERVRIDPKTFNAARIICIPGTMKCKGSNVPDRPWRMATLDSNTEWGDPLDVQAWVEEHGVGVKATVSVAQTLPKLPSLNGVPLDRRIISYLAKFDPAVMGNYGSDQTFDAACVIVKGFGLSIEEARPYLEAWNQTHCSPPWSDAEMDHKLRDADKKWDDKPRGYLRDAPPPEKHEQTNGTSNGHTAPPPTISAAQQGGEAIDVRSEDDPHRLAEGFLARHFWHADGIRLRYWAEEWLVWDGACYRVVPVVEIRAQLSEYIEEIFLASYAQALMRYGMKKDGEKGKLPVCRHVGVGLVSNVVLALSGKCLLTLQDHPSPPCWVADDGDPDEPWNPSLVLPTRGGLVYMPEIVGGSVGARLATPRFFCKHSLEYDFDSNAPDPVNWLTFLGSHETKEGGEVQLQLWRNDPQSIETLQEWFGLNITPDTSHHKIMALIGPRRSGKGTIARIMARMIGLDNVAGPTLSGLAGDFGMEPLIGKLSAIIDDAHISGRIDTGIIVERLLSISGEGNLTVGRKHISSWTGRLPTRFTLISNEIPRLNEASSALAGRFIFLRFTESFYGREDRLLEEKLARELPGILLWAAEGWRRLRKRGHFLQPPSGGELVEEMEELSSPIGMFLRDKAQVGPGFSCDVPTIYQAWKVWCEQKGIREPGSEPMFGRNLRAAVSGLTTRQIRRGYFRVRVFEGVGLMSPESEPIDFS